MEACDAAGAGSGASAGGGGVAVALLKSDAPIARATNVAEAGPISNTVLNPSSPFRDTQGGLKTHLPILACQFCKGLFEQPFPHTHAFEFLHAPFVFALRSLKDEV